MQELLAELFWRNDVIDEQAARLCETLPGYREAEQRYIDTSRQVREMVGPELYDRFYSQLMRCTNYEVCAYYSLGLGLRKALIQELFTPRNSSPSPAWS